ncbi:MAG: CsiV family protein, partial [Pseudomonadales bacterium]
MKRLSKRFAVIWLASTMVAVSEAGAAEEITDFLHKNWYEIEFFVFERPQVLDFNTQESLTVTAPRAFPVNIQALRPGPNGYQTFVDPLTRLCLTFPTLRYRLLPEEEIPEPEGEAPSMPVPQIAPELSAEPRLDLMAAMAAFEAELDRSSDRWLASDSFLLGREARLTERRGVGRLLYHGRWIQAVPPRTAPQPILIQAGRKLNRPGTIHELEGTVAVTLGRFLHFEANLFFHAPALGMDPVAIALSPS